MKMIYMIRKDLIMILSDKKALLIILAMPVILMVILSFALKGVFAGGELTGGQIRIAVVKDYDPGNDEKSFRDSLNGGMLAQNMGEAAARDIEKASGDLDPEEIFFHDFLGSKEVTDIISYRTETEAEAEKLLNEEKISAVVILPEKFFCNMKINMLTPFRNEIVIRVLKSPNSDMKGQIVQSVMQSFSDSMSSFVIGKNVLIESAMEHDLGEFQDMDGAVKQIQDALASISVTWKDTALEGRRTITSADYYAAAMLTMFILFAAGHGGRMLLEEKENSTYQRMMTAGVSKLMILAGKMIAVFLIALIQIAVMIIFSHIALRVVWGDLLSVILIGLAAAFAVSGVGAAVASATYRAGNYKMAGIFETIIIQSMALIGGSFIPVEILPDVMQKLSFLSLNGIALKAYQKTMMGYGLEAVSGYILVLLLIGSVFAAIAAFILAGKEGSVLDKRNQAEAA